MNPVLAKLQGKGSAEGSWRAAEEMLRGTEINSGPPMVQGVNGDSKWRYFGEQAEKTWGKRAGDAVGLKNHRRRRESSTGSQGGEETGDTQGGSSRAGEQSAGSAAQKVKP